MLFHDELFYSFSDEFAVTLYLATTAKAGGGRGGVGRD